MFSSGKGIFVTISVAAATVIYAVHYQQTYDKAEMHKGVLRDRERRAKKKTAIKSNGNN
jgi:hypothetical protein